MITEDEEPTTIKVWFGTRRLLRFIAATTGETMMQATHRIFQAELGRLQVELPAHDGGSGVLSLNPNPGRNLTVQSGQSDDRDDDIEL